MSLHISAKVLLKGAWLAIQQAGYLVRDASILFDAGSHASAVALAMLSHEEIGRHKILIDHWRRTKAGRQFSPNDVREACCDHEEKQREGLSSLTYRTTVDTGFGKLLQSLFNLVPSSSVARKIRSMIEKIDRQKAKRLPEDRHKIRMRAVYVDVNDSGTDWRTPS